MSQKYNTEKFKKVLPKRLTELLEEKGVTQEEAANDLVMARQTLGRYMRGETSPNPELLIKLAKYLEVSSDYLLGLSDLRIPDIEIEAASNLTGLSTKTISILNGRPDDLISAFVDMILCDSQLTDDIFGYLMTIDDFMNSCLYQEKSYSDYSYHKELACFAAFRLTTKLYQMLEQYINTKDSSAVHSALVDLERTRIESGEEEYKRARAEAEDTEYQEMVKCVNYYMSKEHIT